jgi:hypothetical protein
VSKGIELLTCLLLDNGGGFLVALLTGDALGVAHQENGLGMLLDLRATLLYLSEQVLHVSGANIFINFVDCAH